jgi:hypothetical protein
LQHLLETHEARIRLDFGNTRLAYPDKRADLSLRQAALLPERP